MAILSFEAEEVKYVIHQVGKCQYHGPWAINEKTKDTFFSSTFKV